MLLDCNQRVTRFDGVVSVAVRLTDRGVVAEGTSLAAEPGVEQELSVTGASSALPIYSIDDHVVAASGRATRREVYK